MSEARWLAEERMREVSAMPLDALVELIEHPAEAEVSGRSGGAFRVRTYAFWDMEPYESDLIVRADVRGRGLRALDRYHGIDLRGPDTDFTPSEEYVDISSTWSENLAWAIFVVVLGALLAPILFGVRYVASRLP
jgi:hypothetical protein